MTRSGKGPAPSRSPAVPKSPTKSEPGLLLVFFDAPDTPSTTDWLFGEHAEEVVANVPGVWRSRSFQVLNPARPGQSQWLTILESDDIASTWHHRWMASSKAGQEAANRHGVANRREFFVRGMNDVQRKTKRPREA